MKKLTYREVVEDTVKYYSEDTNRRALEGPSCTYYNPENGNMCAVGRYMYEPNKFTIGDIGELDFLSLLDDFKFEDIMKDEVKHLTDTSFWRTLQSLHDASVYWLDNNLSEAGENKYEELLKLADELDGQS